MNRRDVVFGSARNRPLYSREAPTSRFGLLYCQLETTLDPGAYHNNVMTMALDAKTKISSRKGYATRTTQRFSETGKQVTPSPAEYQRLDNTSRTKPVIAAKPFSVGAERFKMKPEAEVPGPGTYHLEKAKVKKKKDNEDVFPVYIKCCIVNNDKCSICECTPTGDYYKLKLTVFCGNCYKTEILTPDKERDGFLRGFRKVRDCSFMHDHQGATSVQQLLKEKSTITSSKQVFYVKLRVHV